MRQSMIKTPIRKIVDKVRIPDDIFERLWPSTVLLKIGLISGGILLPIVSTNQLDGQKI